MGEIRAFSHRHFSTSFLLLVCCALGGLAACGTDPADSGDAGSTSPAPVADGGGAGGDGGDTFGSDGGNATHQLTVSPATATVTITGKAVAAKQTFVAALDGQPITSAVTWTLDAYDVGTIGPDGTFTTSALAGGTVTVNVSAGNLKASAKVTVNVDLSETVKQSASDPGPSAANTNALAGAPQADPGGANATKILYPYDKTVMPRGLTAPLLQFSPGSIPPEDALVELDAPTFRWKGLLHVLAPGTPQFSIPQDIWDGALQTAGGQRLTISVTKAAKGVAYGPAQTSIVVAPASLRGAVYYMTYQTPGNGLYSVRPGVREPAKLILPGCVVCHSVSANGTRLAVGADELPYTTQSGIYDVGSDGNASQVTGSPTGLGGDSRGMSYATFTPDGKYVMRSQNNFWGGVNQMAWKIDDAKKALVPATVVGLGASVNAFLPAISGDSKRYAFTNGDAFGTPRRSISLMDLAIDANSDTLTFSNRQLLLDNGASGAVAKFVNFLPDSNYLVLQEGENYTTGFDMMLPTWGPNNSYTTSTGRLYMLSAQTKEHIELANLNAGNADIDRQRNYEPFPLPVTAGGYFWVVFTSIREYGNTYTGANVRKQLWVAAISSNPAAGADPSHPPFYLPNQSNTGNERGAWALEPCRGDGKQCDTGDECCNGFCRPQNASDPKSPKVCQPPPAGGCALTSEKCSADSDCCDVGSGTRCIGGYCTTKPPS